MKTFEFILIYSDANVGFEAPKKHKGVRKLNTRGYQMKNVVKNKKSKTLPLVSKRI